jgi:hypothetical protein
LWEVEVEEVEVETCCAAVSSDSDSESERTMMVFEWWLVGCGPMHATQLFDFRRLTRVQLGQVHVVEDFEEEDLEDVGAAGVFLASRSFLSSFRIEFILSSVKFNQKRCDSKAWKGRDVKQMNFQNFKGFQNWRSIWPQNIKKSLSLTSLIPSRPLTVLVLNKYHNSNTSRATGTTGP